MDVVAPVSLEKGKMRGTVEVGRLFGTKAEVEIEVED